MGKESSLVVSGCIPIQMYIGNGYTMVYSSLLPPPNNRRPSACRKKGDLWPGGWFAINDPQTKGVLGLGSPYCRQFRSRWCAWVWISLPPRECDAARFQVCFESFAHTPSAYEALLGPFRSSL